jgi:DNA (cytosine-5)-methyltransferase 1
LGKKNPDDVRNKLWREFVRVVLESQADVFVFENVDRFSRTVEYDLLRGETSENGQLAEFETKLFTLNAADFGAPQKRMRSIIIGSRIGEPTCPQQTHDRTGEGLPNWRTVRDAIGELNWHVKDLPLPAQQDLFEGRPVGGRFKLDDIHVSRRYDDASLARFDCIPPGGNRFDLPWDLQTRGWRLHKTGAADVMGRLVWDQPSVTIRTEFHKPEKGRYIHPQWEKEGVRVNRALTLAEGALLQGFDDQHVWCGSKVGIARQIGNAVPPPLAEALAKQVKSLVRPGATVSEQPAG